MSEKRIGTVCLVIDSSVARAAGGHQSLHPLGTACREFLMRVRGICHRLAWGKKIEEEWNKHQSTFALTWLTSMNNLRKLVPVDDTPAEALVEQIAECVADDGVVAAMQKDAHLLAAAMQTDRRIVALDETVRRHYARQLREHHSVMEIVWVNPGVEAERTVQWLEASCPIETARQLSQADG